MGEDQEPACTAASALVFLIALTAGTGCTVAAKSIFGLSGVGITGEVEQFRLLPIAEVLRSLREDLPVWKPNSALVAIDFLVRHRLVSESEPGYAELVRLLRQRVS